MSIYSPIFIKIINNIKPQIRQKIDVLSKDFKSLKVSKKADRTLVTEFDLFISDLFKEEIKGNFPEMNFYSEEDQGNFDFPICIIDPIDGTREFAMGMDECAVSVGIYSSSEIGDTNNISWIYNPITEFEVSSLESIPIKLESTDNHSLQALVSRTEFDKGLHQDTEGIKFSPKGSIAFKLALLARGECDFVITKKDKNVWDILAGTHICLLNGIKLFQGDNQITSISKETYKSPMIWRSDKIEKQISKMK